MKTMMATAALLALLCDGVLAADAAGAANASVPDAGKPAVAPSKALIADTGKSLNDAGLFPILIFGETYVGNRNMGAIPDSGQVGTFLLYGFDYYPKALSGTSFHFTSSATRKTDTSYFAESGDEIVAGAASNLPRTSHLTRATVMQEFANGQYLLEGGKGYANDYMARPLCNNAYLCMSVIDGTHKLAGINFPNYSNWFLRAADKVTDKMKVQLAMFEYSTAAAGFGTSESGWEGWRPTYYQSWFADMQWADTKSARPSSYELMPFYNNIPQADSITGSTANPTPTHHQSGLFGSTMQTLWRPDGGPTALQAFGSGAWAFNGQQTQTPSTAGLKYAVDFGLTLKSPVQGRPFDSYSIQFSQVGLTTDEQTYLAKKGYANGSSEKAFALSANFRVLDYVFLQPYVQYLWDVQANNYVSLAGLHNFVPAAPVIPTGRPVADGMAFGLTLVIPFDRLFGLTTRSSGYDGHYP